MTPRPLDNANSHDANLCERLAAFRKDYNASKDMVRSRFSLTVNELAVLQAVSEQTTSSPTRIAKEAFLERSSTSRAVGLLVQKHCLREVVNPSDRRSIQLALTEKGRTLLSRVCDFCGSETLENAFAWRQYCAECASNEKKPLDILVLMDLSEHARPLTASEIARDLDVSLTSVADSLRRLKASGDATVDGKRRMARWSPACTAV